MLMMIKLKDKDYNAHNNDDGVIILNIYF